MNQTRMIRGEHESRRSTAMVVAMLIVVLLAGVMTERSYASSYLFKSTTIYADGTRTAKFTCNGMTGFCCEAGAFSTYSGTASLSRLKNTTNAAYCAYYYGYQKGWTSGSNGHKLARLLSYCMGHGTGGDFSTSTMKSLLAAAKKTSVPAGFECWLCKPNGSSKQDFIVWKYPKGKLKVVKKSGSTGVSKKGAYSLAGMTIKVYSDAACKTCVKTLTTAKDGSTGGAFSLHVGTYYVKETKVPGSTGFVKNDKVMKVKVTSGSTASVTVTNAPDTGSVSIEKTTAGEGGSIEGFRFLLTGKTSGKSYELVTDAEGKASVDGLPFGKYTLTEQMTAEQEVIYTDCTGVQNFTLAKGTDTQHITLQRENRYEPQQKLKILKRTGDSGPVSDFTFRIQWLRANQKTITGEDIVRAADPQIALAEGQSAGIWQIEDPAQVEAINEAAAKGETGNFPVTLRNTVTTAATEQTVPNAAASELQGSQAEAEGGEMRDAEGADAMQAAGAGESGTGADGAQTGGDSGKAATTANAVSENDASAANAGNRDGALADDVRSDDAKQAASGGDSAGSEDKASEDTADEASAEGNDAGAADTDAADDTSAQPNGSVDGTDAPSQISVDGRTDTVTVQVEVKLMPVSQDADATGKEASSEDQVGEPAEETEMQEGAPNLMQAGTASALQTGEAQEQQSGTFAISCRSITFAGAAVSGEETAETDGAGQILLEHVWPGAYTVTEEMTDQQKLRYRQPQPQTAVVEADREETVVFTFMNDPIRVPVKLQKVSADGNIADMEFTISGIPDYAKESAADAEVSGDGDADDARERTGEAAQTGTGDAGGAEVAAENVVVQTDENGIADFGMLYPGTYRVEETGFDKERYQNTYPLGDGENPAFVFRVTGEELTPAQIQDGACLWLGGEPGKGELSAEKVTFRNIPYVDLRLTKVDGITRSFLPGAEFSLKDSSGTEVADFRIDADEEGQPLPVLQKGNGSVTLAQAEDAAGEPLVIGGSAQTGSGENVTGGETKASDEAAKGSGASQTGGAEQDSDGIAVMRAQEENDVNASTDADQSAVTYPCILLQGLLAEEKYTLTETQAPEGFTPLEQPYVFTVRIDEQGHSSLQTCDEYGASIAASARGDVLVVVNDAPTIGTVALDNATGEHIADAGSTVTMTDNCRVSNLVPGKTYTMVARLMDNTEYLAGGDDGTVVQVTEEGEPVTGQVTFVADGREDTVRVPVTMQAASLAGHSTVIYESLYTGEVTAAEADGMTAAAEESNPGNASQTVIFPKIGTKAALSRGGTIRDQVTYENLLPRRQYVMAGVLMDRSSGEVIEGSAADKTFYTDDSGSGTVTVKLTADAAELAEQGIKEVVAFERCYLLKENDGGSGESRVQVAAHEDLENEDQTVTLPAPGTTHSPHTGDDTALPWAVLSMLLAAAFIGILLTASGLRRSGGARR